MYYFLFIGGVFFMDLKYYLCNMDEVQVVFIVYFYNFIIFIGYYYVEKMICYKNLEVNIIFFCFF